MVFWPLQALGTRGKQTDTQTNTHIKVPGLELAISGSDYTRNRSLQEVVAKWWQYSEALTYPPVCQFSVTMTHTLETAGRRTQFVHRYLLFDQNTNKIKWYLKFGLFLRDSRLSESQMDCRTYSSKLGIYDYMLLCDNLVYMTTVSCLFDNSVGLFI